MTVFVICFAVLAVVHLYGCYFHREKLRRATKPLLLLSLALFYAFAARPFDPFVLAALVCGFLGDIFLLRTDDLRFFLTGACIFSLGHVCYALVLFTHASLGALGSSAWLVALIAAIYIIVVACAGARVVPYIKKTFLKRMMPAYLALVGVVNVGAWLAFICAVNSGGNAFGASLIVLGSILFLASDTVLSCGVFRREGPRTNFYVMLTYIAAQFCLCMGFMRFL